MILILVMLCCACSAQSNLENVSQTGAETNQNTPSAAAEENANRAWNATGAFRMALPCDITVYGSGNDAEFYEVFLRGRVNEYVIVNVMASNMLKENGNIELVFQNYAINIDTGEMRELSLSNYYSATQVPIQIIAQFSDKFPVHAKVEEVTNANSPIPLTERSPGIISKEDYLASAPNYQMITSLRKPI